MFDKKQSINAKAMLKLLDLMGFQVDAQTGGILKVGISNLTLNKIQDDFLLNFPKGRSIRFHKGTVFIKTVQETERILKVKLFT